MAGWKVRLTLALVLLAFAPMRPVSLAQPADAPAGEKLAYSVRDLTVQITSYQGQNIAAEGYGFVVGQQADAVTIVTADHVVRDPDGAEYGQVRVVFFADQAHPQIATVLDLRMPPAYGDLAVLEVRKPGFRMAQPPIAPLPLTFGERAWRVGKQRGWTPGNLPGVFTGTERTIWLGFDNLDTPRGSSGGPIVVAQGLVGMVTDDQSGRALVLPVGIIENFFREKGLPWGPSGSSQASVPTQSVPTTTSSAPAGFRVTGAALRALSDTYKGKCPVTLSFTGSISADGGSGIVSYRFVYGSGGVWGPFSLRFDGPETKEVNNRMWFGAPEMNFSDWAEIEVLSPNPFKSNKALVSFECAQALPASGAPSGSSPASAPAQSAPTTTSSAPSGFRVTEATLRAVQDSYKGECPVMMPFTGSISTVGGSGMVSYKLVKSDNSVYGFTSLKFDGPGSKKVDGRIRFGEPQLKFSDWAEIEVVAPNPFKSDHALISIECTPGLPASVVSVNISKASCSKVGEGSFRVEMSGDATSPEDAFLSLAATGYRPNHKNTQDINCGVWNNVTSGAYHRCQRMENQPSQTKWVYVGILYDQQATVPSQADAEVLKESPGNGPLVFLAEDHRKLVCQ